MGNTNLITKIFYKFRNLILYGIIGSCSSFLDFITYTFLIRIGEFNYLIANCISVIIGIVTSFILNRKYNFKVKDKTAKRFSIFLTIGLCGMLMSNLILYICIDCLSLDEIISKLCSIVFVVIIQFILNKYITFKPTQNHG